MSHYETMMTKIRAHAFRVGAAKLAGEADMHPDTLRAILGDKPPKSVMLLRRLAEISEETPAAAGADETGKEEQPHG